MRFILDIDQDSQMHYYKRNIGDYAKRAGRLSLLQHGVYTQLLDACYEREAFPTEQEAIDWVWASSTEEIEAVRFVLRRLFKEEEGRFVHDEVLNNLSTYHAHGEANRVIALAREAKKRAAKQHEKARTVHEPCEVEHEPCTNRAKKAPNHKPINQEPITNNHPNTRESTAIADAPTPKPKASPVVKPETVEQQIWDDWLQLRKNKKAPVTKTVVQGAIVEAGKAGMPLNDFFAEWCTRGSQGLKAEWLVNTGKGQKPQGGTVNGVGVSATTVGNVQAMQEYFAKKGEVFHAEIGTKESQAANDKNNDVIDV